MQCANCGVKMLSDNLGTYCPNPQCHFSPDFLGAAVEEIELGDDDDLDDDDLDRDDEDGNYSMYDNDD